MASAAKTICIVGDCTVVRAKSRAEPNLGLSNVTVEWEGERKELGEINVWLEHKADKPTHVIIHENELEPTKDELVDKLKTLISSHDKITFVWSDILDLRGIDSTQRGKMNKAAKKEVKKKVIGHPKMTTSFPYRYRRLYTDNWRKLSDDGVDQFIDDVKKGIQGL